MKKLFLATAAVAALIAAPAAAQNVGSVGLTYANTDYDGAFDSDTWTVDGTVADVCSSDVVLGGVYNHMQVFLSNGRIECKMNPMDAVMAYGPSDDSFGDEYLAEKISTRQGWNYASPDEHWASGYHQEIQDFVEAIVEDRAPLSGWSLARDVTAVIFAAYVSAWEGRRVEVPR